MASRKINTEELANLILELLDFMMIGGNKLNTNEIQEKLAKILQVYADLSEITYALTYLNSKKKIEIGSFYMAGTLNGSVISCFVRKNRGEAKP